VRISTSAREKARLDLARRAVLRLQQQQELTATELFSGTAQELREQGTTNWQVQLVRVLIRLGWVERARRLKQADGTFEVWYRSTAVGSSALEVDDVVLADLLSQAVSRRPMATIVERMAGQPGPDLEGSGLDDGPGEADVDPDEEADGVEAEGDDERATRFLSQPRRRQLAIDGMFMGGQVSERHAHEAELDEAQPAPQDEAQAPEMSMEQKVDLVASIVPFLVGTLQNLEEKVSALASQVRLDVRHLEAILETNEAVVNLASSSLPDMSADVSAVAVDPVVERQIDYSPQCSWEDFQAAKIVGSHGNGCTFPNSLTIAIAELLREAPMHARHAASHAARRNASGLPDARVAGAPSSADDEDGE
jgi:hypothetical protein